MLNIVHTLVFAWQDVGLEECVCCWRVALLLSCHVWVKCRDVDRLEQWIRVARILLRNEFASLVEGLNV